MLELGHPVPQFDVSFPVKLLKIVASSLGAGLAAVFKPNQSGGLLLYFGRVLKISAVYVVVIPLSTVG